MSLHYFGFVGHRADGRKFHAGTGSAPESEIHCHGVGFGGYSKGPSLPALPSFFFPRAHATSLPRLDPDRGGSSTWKSFQGKAGMRRLPEHRACGGFQRRVDKKTGCFYRGLMVRLTALTIATALLASFWSTRVSAQTATTPGAITTPYPTTQGISIEWAIMGDSNNNSVVTVRYRPAGTTTWKTGMALFRIPAGSNDTGSFGSGNGQWSNKHSGSLFDLDPGTSYEIELTLTDPDGGSTTQTTTVATRPIPQATATATTKAVTPTNFSTTLAGAAPGDILLMAAGNYPAFTVSRSGTEGQPIVLRGTSVDGVVIQGRVTMDDQNYVYLENVTVQGEVRMHGASNMVVRGCHIQSTGEGIDFEIGNAVPRNNYIVDNDVVGAAVWVDSQLSSDGFNGGEGIQFTGSGHVVCFNHVKGFRDDISLMEYDEAYEQVSIDICNNDIEEATDDAVEADSAMGNVRVVRNRVRNCFDGMSSQPDLGGPTYYIQNTMYNVLYSPFKFHNGTVGDVVLHNTVVKCGDAFGCYAGATWSRAFFRNNLFIGGIGGGTYGGYGNGSGNVLDLADADATCSFDYDGLGSIGTNTFAGKIGATRFTSLATLKANTTEVHAVQVDMSVFADAVPFPSNPYPPKPVVDLQLAAGGAAIDKGVVIVGLNDGFSGAAPDLGAYELGATSPVYGPRTAGTGGSGVGGASGSSGGASGGVSTSSTGGAKGGNSGTSGAGGTSDASAYSGGTGGTSGASAGASSAGGSAGNGGPGGTSGSPVGTGSDSPDGGPATGKAAGGCGCSHSGGGGGAASLALIVLVLAVRRRQARAARSGVRT
jgi:MYXO-CTERM domain-containing protein